MTTTTIPYCVSISYKVPCELYMLNYNRSKKRTKYIPLNDALATELYATIGKYRSYFRYGDPNTLSQEELVSNFISDDFGRVAIKEETVRLNKGFGKTQQGTLNVNYELVVNAPEGTVFTMEHIEGLVYNAFIPTYSENRIVHVPDHDVYLEVTDTPSQEGLTYSVIPESLVRELQEIPNQKKNPKKQPKAKKQHKVT